jgi:hypothetical protein
LSLPLTDRFPLPKDSLGIIFDPTSDGPKKRKDTISKRVSNFGTFGKKASKILQDGPGSVRGTTSTEFSLALMDENPTPSDSSNIGSSTLGAPRLLNKLKSQDINRSATKLTARRKDFDAFEEHDGEFLFQRTPPLLPFDELMESIPQKSESRSLSSFNRAAMIMNKIVKKSSSDVKSGDPFSLYSLSNSSSSASSSHSSSSRISTSSSQNSALLDGDTATFFDDAPSSAKFSHRLSRNVSVSFDDSTIPRGSASLSTIVGNSAFKNDRSQLTQSTAIPLSKFSMSSSAHPQSHLMTAGDLIDCTRNSAAQSKEEIGDKSANPFDMPESFTPPLSNEDLLQIDFDEISDGEILGSGTFGEAMKVQWKNQIGIGLFITFFFD